jgi:hypothetical protein
VRNTIEPHVILSLLVSCFVELTPVALRAIKTELDKVDPYARQIYVINLKKMLEASPLFNQRVNEKTYAQLKNTLNEILKASYYRNKVNNESDD